MPTLESMKPLARTKPWCRKIVELVDLGFDQKPVCQCGERAGWVVGFGQGWGPPLPELVCLEHMREFCFAHELRPSRGARQ